MATPLKIYGYPKWLASQDEEDVSNARYKRSIRYYKKLYKACPKWANQDKIAAIYREAKRRRKRGEQVQVDHSVPISHPHVSGLHNEFNLQIMTETENLRKGNHWWPDMWEEQADLGFPTVVCYQLSLGL